jgi:hypothetical protein
MPDGETRRDTRERNLDRAKDLAVHGRISAQEILRVAESFDKHLDEKTLGR